MALPAELQPPFEVALARPVSSIPAAGALPGGSRYEPKWDGFRLCIVVDEQVSLWSRQGKDLTKRFPDLVAAAEQLPDGVILDGEVVFWSPEGRLEFDALLRRLNAGGKRLRELVHAEPVSYAAFDVLAVAGRDTRGLGLNGRRELLEELAQDWSPPLNLSPITSDPAEAERWFDALVPSGVEGLVVKGGAQAYRGGQRDWVKVKHRDTRDVVCGAVIGSRERPRELVLGLPVKGELRIVGRSSVLPAAASRALGEILQAPGGDHPWPAEVKTGALSRFNRDGRGPVALTLVEPIVVEISADTATTGYSFRHAVRFVRARPEVPVEEVDAGDDVSIGVI
ncbi:ATP-dependent DNA ligase [Zhihengliuella sp. ISTPL4]|uniref:ATP-dependent DNA ligase n=1 Tax=Zhihengliuella sp. ISTPL4 TaxID=2058657 RepID=UPI000C7B7400|nr:ATP-dependent DNA ligase [Zhihengliuella sp. ISTPL4]